MRHTRLQLRCACAIVLLVALAALPAGWAARSETGTPRAMQGPMAGYVTPHEIHLWVRVSGEFPVAVEYGRDADLGDARVTEPIQATVAGDLIVKPVLSGLEANTTYYYRILINGVPDSYKKHMKPYAVKTAPAPDAPARFRVCFGSCARVQVDREQKIWDAVQWLAPDLFFWIGDNIYGDSLVPSILAEQFRIQRTVPSLEPVLRAVPQLAIWDDHDFGLNDHDRTNPIKEQALAVFEREWLNPSYGLPDAPGCFFRYQYGGVDFFMLDIRYHRDPNDAPDTPGKTMLGAGQRAWLEAGLRDSRAPFKVLVSGSGWTAAKGEGGDSWAAFLHERNALFEFIRVNEISGVVLVSGDTHTGELNCIPWSEKGGYDLYDLVSSPLAQAGSNEWRKRNPEVRLRPGYPMPNVGVIDFDLTGATPRLVFNLYDVNNEPVWNPLELTADELRNGVTSYPGKKEYP